VTPQVVHLIEILTGEMSRGDLMEGVGLKDRMNFSHHYLTPALESELIEMTLPDKPRSSKQRYRLSKLGKQWLQANVR
jgi:ATP-dependent DNA helicase RecG